MRFIRGILSRDPREQVHYRLGLRADRSEGRDGLQPDRSRAEVRGHAEDADCLGFVFGLLETDERRRVEQRDTHSRIGFAAVGRRLHPGEDELARVFANVRPEDGKAAKGSFTDRGVGVGHVLEPTLLVLAGEFRRPLRFGELGRPLNLFGVFRVFRILTRGERFARRGSDQAERRV